ncbi:NADPH-dependent oxidoreductase [Pseudooceanicola nanhaiensis]|uniref:NADPH-dependent oxidoreductase n=1 Tax=Pseudooceanicola nanhaiensis TaxID=375761 RepID=UPI001CD272CD|nr:NADPH-dependent oxidoreductase [Pseudooceanicola nanhaiensis]MCA0922664.1 NADPH-dependent oxidoreductase [Pseudooceanicola nanhaiensis]
MTFQKDVETRYGGLMPAKPLIEATAVMEQMMSHRSVRSYEDRPLPEGMLETLLAAGQSGASSSNMQAISIVAVRDPARKAELAEMGRQPFLATAPVILCFVADHSRAARIGARTGVDLFTLPYMDNLLAATCDCAIVAQNMVLAAESLGVGSCYVGNLRNEPARLAKLLNLPPRAVVIFGLTMGYEAPPVTGVRPRLPQGVVLHEETYNRDEAAEAQIMAEYDAVFARHEAGQNRPPVTFSQRNAERYASAEYLSGRDKLKAQLQDMGFPLL